MKRNHVRSNTLVSKDVRDLDDHRRQEVCKREGEKGAEDPFDSAVRALGLFGGCLSIAADPCPTEPPPLVGSYRFTKLFAPD